MSADRVVSEEIALATGVGIGEVARRLSLATAPRRHRTILAALRSGATTLHRALQVASETTALPDADVAAVEEAVLAPVPGRAALVAADVRDPAAACDRLRRRPRVRRAPRPRAVAAGRVRPAHRRRHGLPHPRRRCRRVAAVMDRLDAQARAARGAGDPRTLDQLRCDLATEALLRSHLEACSP